MKTLIVATTRLSGILSEHGTYIPWLGQADWLDMLQSIIAKRPVVVCGTDEEVRFYTDRISTHFVVVGLPVLEGVHMTTSLESAQSYIRETFATDDFCVIGSSDIILEEATKTADEIWHAKFDLILAGGPRFLIPEGFQNVATCVQRVKLPKPNGDQSHWLARHEGDTIVTGAEFLHYLRK